MLVIYVAGPFTGVNAWEVEQNIRRAEEIAFEIAKLGAMPLCPHANTRFFHGTLTPAFWYEGTLELLKRCDAIMMVSGWSRSQGAVREHDWAQANGMPIFLDTNISAWIHEKTS